VVRVQLAAVPSRRCSRSPPLQDIIKVTRQVLHWFEISSNRTRFSPESKCPVFIWQPIGFPDDLYGFPALDSAASCAKVAWEQKGSAVDADHVDRTVAAHHIPGLS